MLHLIRPKALRHHNPVLNFRGKWQRGDYISIWYLIYQLICCCFLVGNVVFTWIRQADKAPDQRWKYVIYLTHWGILTINTAVIIETICTVYIYFKVSSGEKTGRILERLLHLSWGLTYATYSAALFISGLYWSLLYEGEQLSYINFYVHGIQGVYSTLDQLITSRDWEGGHWWICLVMPIIYCFFNVIYWAAGGTNEKGEPFIYPVLDWSKSPGQAAGLCCGGVLLLVVIHYLFVLLTWVRDKLHLMCCPHHEYA